MHRRSHGSIKGCFFLPDLLLSRNEPFFSGDSPIPQSQTAYRAANRLLPNDVITQYNMGMTLVALKKYKEAAQLAQKVYSTGFPLPALKNKLIAAGHWKAEAEETASNNQKQDLTPAQVDAIKKAMENLTPAQRDALEKAMQDQAGRKEGAPVAAAP